MALVKWNRNTDVMPGFSNLIDTFLGRDVSDVLGDYTGTVPAVNIRETKDSFKLEVAAPGMAKKDFDIKLENNVLTISGKKEEVKEEKSERFNRREFNYTSFQRSFNLPEAVNVESIEAHYENGLLMVSVPKKEEAKEKEAKKISIT